MLKPHKYLDLDHSVLRISTRILEELMKMRKMEYIDLFNILEKEFGDATDEIFLPAINFLYLLDKLDYSIQSDTLELIP
ncbi:ABC-three component system middle component 7 [Cohnella luojiensis]|uniref:Uncharacterized protein n=1 Tax=Cohnella luojiensis TaxID=652876 RepID=A0A4Y8LSR5_9BACL|nr:ABC-three component system middle component 8 [Cohnella luojiensis]TFE23993.1 hypothetical protein E2980_17435 [Cohnella luojiensis]